MKHPKDSTDPLDRHNAAGAQTVIIGGDHGANSGDPTRLVEATTPKQSFESGAARNPPPAGAAPPTRAIPSDPGHTRILMPGGGTAGTGANRSTEPIVGWLVVLDGMGKGQARGIYTGANTIGRNSNQRIPIDFGDDSISGEQQAFLVYDARMRKFSLVPNLSRPNLVMHNDAALLSNTQLNSRDRITMGSTTLLFVPLCGPDFDWSDASMMSKAPSA